MQTREGRAEQQSEVSAEMRRELRKSMWKTLRCQDVEELVDEYLDGEMTDGTKWRFEAHLMRCECCRSMVEDFQNIVTAARSLAERPIDPGVQRRLREALFEQVGFQNPDRPVLKLVKE